MRQKYIVITPVAEKDTGVLEISIPYIMKFIPLKKLIIIGNDKVLHQLQEKSILSTIVEFMNEDELVALREVKDVISEISEKNEKAIKRSGWYLQQFIKMKYAQVCEDEFYIVWDADTIPLKNIEMFESGKPVFDMKTEYNQLYFDTMSRLIPDLKKMVEGSFISEHMVVHSGTMRELINEIEENDNSEQDREFWNIILRAVDKAELHHAGFSEFETYGNYCMIRKKGMYVLSKYDSLRWGGEYFAVDVFDAEIADWVGKDFMAVSFEQSSALLPEHKIYSWKWVHRVFKFKTLYNAQSVFKMINRIYRKIKKTLAFWGKA